MVAEEEQKGFASPACSAHEMDDRYMGFASREELLATLNELLEAERAGAQVTLRTAKQMTDQSLAPLMTDIQHDEARWCAMLTKAILRLHGEPSHKIGIFHDKAMAIEDTSLRLAFLNRGQAWVVRKLEALLPTVRDDRLYAELKAMLVSHRQNVERVASQLASTAT
jgi:hypothetical protein